MIRKCEKADFHGLLTIINDGAQAYKGVIPADSWQEPYMSSDGLRNEISSGVEFSGYEFGGSLVGVMGVQTREGVFLIRHAYVRHERQRRGVGTSLLRHLITSVDKPILIGTWRAAIWALRFYEKNGFSVVPESEKNKLLKTYWDVPSRQAEASVVLADYQARNTIVRVTADENREGTERI
ncbi:MAG: GNAT family N-acetyltransferase [Pseudomonadota bacterium]|nr:GNAT family N-acetyltransferase [Pseudomonadota bacterium]